LINTPFDDPGLFVPFLFENRALVFDLGECSALAPRDLLKATHVFITHTHMDHFIGFDRLLRLFLGRQRDLYFFGPAGFLENCRGKLSGYAWNLVQHFNYRLALHFTEVHPHRCLQLTCRCRDRFEPREGPRESPFDGVLLREAGFEVSAAVLDHGIPCLGFALKERFHVNIIKAKLAALDLAPGPWLTDFKQALYERADPRTPFQVPMGPGGSAPKQFRLGELAERIAVVTPGQKIAYVVDAAYHRENRKAIVELARDADHLFIEAAFLEEHGEIARAKHHLTARQAGSLAGLAGVRQYTLFHFSPRYLSREEELWEEARRAFETTGKRAGARQMQDRATPPETAEA